MLIIGVLVGFGAGVVTSLYAPRVWKSVTAGVKRKLDKIADDIGTGL